MTVHPYGLDAIFAESGTIEPPVSRRAPRIAAVGLGAPRSFPFHQPNGHSNPDWTYGVLPAGWTAAVGRPDEFLIQAKNAGGAQQSYAFRVARPFSLDVTLTNFIFFRLRVHDAVDSGTIRLGFAAGVTLVLDADGTSRYETARDGGAQLGASGIRSDGMWHTMVLGISSAGVQLWENKASRFEHPQSTASATTDAGTPVVEASFEVFVLQAGGLAQVDIAEVSVLTSTSAVVRARRNADWPGVWEQEIAALVRRHGDALQAANADLVAQIRSVAGGIGPWSLGFGVTLSPDTTTQAEKTVLDPRVQAFIQDARQLLAVRAARLDRPEAVASFSGCTYFVGIGMSASFAVSGSFALGFLFDITTDPITVAFGLTLSGGLGFLADFSVHVIFGVYPLSVDDFLGFGAAVQSSLDLDIPPITLGAGMSGNSPLSFSPLNCGPTITFGLGVGIPFEVGWYQSYTWQIYRFQHQEDAMELDFYLPRENQDWAHFDKWSGHPPQMVFAGTVSQGDGQYLWGGNGNGTLNVSAPDGDGKITAHLSPVPEQGSSLVFVGTYRTTTTNAAGTQLSYSVACPIPFD